LSDHQSQLNQYEVIVIGAGISGLTTALILAKEGWKVALFERDMDIAPLIRPYMRKGCEFSPGLHISGWMDEGEVIDAFFKYLNISDGVEKSLHENGLGNIVIDSKEYRIPKGIDNVEQNLISYFPDDVEAIRNYIRLIKDVNNKNFYFNHNLRPNLNKQSGFIGSTGLSLQEVLQQFQASDSLLELIGTVNYFLIGSKAEEVPFDVHAFVVGGFYRSPGVFTVNGINRLLSNYKRELNKFGVDLFLGSEVSEILVNDNRSVYGVKVLNGDEYFSTTMVVSFNPKLLLEKIKTDKLRPIYRERLDDAENTFGLYVVFYEINDYPDMEVDNYIYYNKNANITIAAITNYSREKKILCVFLIDDAKSMPLNIDEKTILAKDKLRLLEKTIINEIPSFTSLKGNLVYLDYLKPWSFERYTKTISGSAYGIKQTVNSHGFQHLIPVKGLYMVGQAIYPGFLGSMLSGFSLALEFLKPDEFWSKVIN
jgi:all-trans-retinol 13,14-reductase